MADVIWTPDPAVLADDVGGYRLLVYAATSEVLYVLIEGPVLTDAGRPDDPVPLWHLRVTTALGDLPFLRMSCSSSDHSRSFFVARMGARF